MIPILTANIFTNVRPQPFEGKTWRTQKKMNTSKWVTMLLCMPLFKIVYNSNYNLEKRNIPNPNCCSRRMPMKTRLNMFAAKWTIPACNQMQVTSLHPSCWFTTSYHRSAPILDKLKKWSKNLISKYLYTTILAKSWGKKLQFKQMKKTSHHGLKIDVITSFILLII